MTTVEAGAEAAIARIAEAGGARIDPPTLVPARLMVELSGEAVRARLCAFTDEAGVEWCLRPDMTSPIADLVANGREAAGRRHYAGSVYRLPLAGSGDPIEFQQAGFEWFGGAGPEEDAVAAALTLDAAEKGGVRAAEPRFGDVAIFSAVLQALPMSEGWRERLRRAFSRRQGLEGMLANVERRTEEPGDALAEGLAQLPDALASRMIEDVFALAGVRPVGGRSAQEIALRLKARREEGTLDPGAVRAVLAYLDLSSPAEHAVAAIRGFASAHGLNPASLPLEAFEARLARLNALAPPFWKTARFFAATGRRFEYYDGFVFDLVRPDLPDLPIAAGGRYDGLVARLSQGRRQITAIGASIRLDRLSVAGGGA